jgi:hypothetical protein
MTDAQRQCGDCSLCCKVLGIPELNKPKDEWCPNFAAGIGCRIYADRPPSCHNFACRWLNDATMGPEWKPSLCKMVIERRRTIVILPDREEDLGVIGPDARIALERVMTPHGPQWNPRVMGAGEQGASG